MVRVLNEEKPERTLSSPLLSPFLPSRPPYRSLFLPLSSSYTSRSGFRLYGSMASLTMFAAHTLRTIRYTIQQFNVDQKAECDQLYLAHVSRNKKKQ